MIKIFLYIPEDALPQLETHDQVLELRVSEAAEAGPLLVHGDHHLAADLDTGAGLDVVCNNKHEVSGDAADYPSQY